MRPWGFIAPALLGLAASAPAQRFEFTRQMLPAGNYGTAAVALGDVDGDGDLDAFVGNDNSPGLGEQDRLQLNSGTGVFTDVTAANLPSLLDPTRAVALGDVDGDGDLDAYIGNGRDPLGAQDRLLLNVGAGVFTDVTATNLPASSDTTRSVALGDLDGDGDLDAFVGNAGQERLYLNGGTGTFTDVTVTHLPALLNPTLAVALGDVDGDGDLDAFTGNIGQPNRLYRNVGSAVFTDVSATNLPALIDATEDVALGDVDGDGDLDACVGNGSNGQDRLYLNDGTGVYTDVTATNLPVLLDSTKAVALGDVDGDGELDVFVSNLGQQNRLLLNGGTGEFTNVTATNLPALVDASQAVALGDVDGDGDLDALVGNGLGSQRAQNRLYLNGGTGVFTDVTAVSLPAPRDNTLAVALGDVDGDGDVDAYLGTSGVPFGLRQNRLQLNDGTGILTDFTATNLPAFLDDTRAVALGDVDGDGDLDVFVGNSGQQERLYLNGGTGVFADVTATNLPVSLEDTRAVALGDVDGDGDLDAFLGNMGQQDRLYLNGGTGVFTNVTATSLPVLSDATTAVALGDLDGDGDLDAFVGNWSNGQDRLQMNGGTGVFTDVTATNLPPVLDPTRAVALGDVDGDGDVDVLVGNEFFSIGANSRLYLNGGTGLFTNVTATHLPALIDPSTAVALGDVDGDGDLDAFLGSAQNRLYANGGSGVFTDVTATDLPMLSEFSQAVALGDVDGDGDLDAFVANGGVPGLNRLYVNASRQLAWRGIPRIGKPLILDLRGPAFGAWFLGFSFGTADVPIPPLGTLRVDPGSLFLALAGLLDGGGRAAVAYAVPANPSLLGATVYWQAVVAGPARLTNLEVTSLTNL